MKKQTDQQQKIHGITTNHTNHTINKQKKTHNNKLLSPKAGMKEQYVYKAVKHMIKATSFASSFLLLCIFCSPSAW